MGRSSTAKRSANGSRGKIALRMAQTCRARSWSMAMRSAWASIPPFACVSFRPIKRTTRPKNGDAPAVSCVLKCPSLHEQIANGAGPRFLASALGAALSMWTKEALHQLVATKLRDYKLIVVANREPYVHSYTADRQLEWKAPP